MKETFFINPIFAFLKASMVFSIHGVFMDHPYDYKGTATLHLKNITSEVAFDLNNMVVYLFSSFGPLVPDSRDLSQAEKRIIKFQSKRLYRAILCENSCQFVNLLSSACNHFFSV